MDNKLSFSHIEMLLQKYLTTILFIIKHREDIYLVDQT